MNPVIYLQVAKDAGCGLCNQIYAFTGCLDHTLEKKTGFKGTIIVLDSFLQEIQTQQKCPISHIFDLPKMNMMLYSFSILLVTKEKFSGIQITSVTWGESVITTQFLSAFVFDTLLFVPQTFDFRQLEGTSQEVNAHQPQPQPQLKLHCWVEKKPWVMTFETNNGKLTQDLCIQLSFSSELHQKHSLYALQQ
jgi:hypothetical protein